MKTTCAITWSVATCLLAASLSRATDLVHLYEFAGNLRDKLGGRDLIAHGGIVGNGNYTFIPNQGLTLRATPDLAADYSIGIRFVIGDVTGWRKIIDFHDLASDAGMYLQDGRPSFWDPETGGAWMVKPDTVVELVVTRSSMDNNSFIAYLNGSPIPGFFFEDHGNKAVAGQIGDVVPFHFFMDDAETGFEEAFPGSVDEIRVWNGPLLAEEIPSAFQVSVTPLRITEFRTGRSNNNEWNSALSWNSQPGGIYTVEFSLDLVVWVELNNGVQSQGAVTTYEDISRGGANPKIGFYRVREGGAPN